jgi:hypothetical protein
MDVRSAIDNYLSVVCSPAGDEQGRVDRLKSSLDELALLARTMHDHFDETSYPEPPRINPSSWDTVERRFPALGFYKLDLNVPGRLSETLGASAIEDIVEIAGDLAAIAWRFEHNSSDDALFHFRLTFQSHWGLHLRCLQLYLHDL